MIVWSMGGQVTRYKPRYHTYSVSIQAFDNLAAVNCWETLTCRFICLSTISEIQQRAKHIRIGSYRPTTDDRYLQFSYSNNIVRVTHILIRIYLGLYHSWSAAPSLHSTTVPVAFCLFVSCCTLDGTLSGTHVYISTVGCLLQRQYPAAIFLVVFLISFFFLSLLLLFWGSHRSEMMNTDNVSKGYVALMVKRLEYYMVDWYNVACG